MPINKDIVIQQFHAYRRGEVFSHHLVSIEIFQISYNKTKRLLLPNNILDVIGVSLASRPPCTPSPGAVCTQRAKTPRQKYTKTMNRQNIFKLFYVHPRNN